MKLPVKQLGFILSSFLLFLFITIRPSFSYAAFEGGINIGPHTNKTQNTLSSISDSGWVYILMQPTQEDKNTLFTLLEEYPNARFIIRGHTPDNQGNSLTSAYAQNWNSFFTGLLSTQGRVVYFVPVNEPNNPNESQNSQGIGGIPPQTVKNYINALRSVGLFDNPAVRVLSPAMDVFNLSDGPDYKSSQNYANQLKGPNGEDFFSQFDGVSLNLYGQFNGNQIDGSAPDIKRGLKYREFMRDYLGIPQNIAATMPVFAVETGVLKVNEGIKYEPFTNDIATYLNSVSKEWGSDNNFIMYSIFSYDPAIQPPTHWIFNNVTVLQAMGHTVQYVVTPIPTGTQLQLTPESGIIPQISTDDALGTLYNITQRSNVRLLPQSIQVANKAAQKETNCILGLKIGNNCILGSEGALAGETEKFQPVYVQSTKVVNAEVVCTNIVCQLSNLLTNIIAPQMSDKPTGALNAYRPSRLNFSTSQSGNSNDQVLAETSNPKKEAVDSYDFTQKILLPHSIGNATVDSPIPQPTISTTPPVFPSTTPFKPPEYRCSTGKEYCSPDFLKDYFPEDAIVEASVICNAESGSNSMAVNKDCLKNTTLDYSIGLFQINLLMHCPNSQEIFEFEYGKNLCTVLDQEKADICEAKFLDPIENIKYAVDLYNKQGWVPWSTASNCGIE